MGLWRGALRGAVVGAAFAGFGFALVFSGADESSSSTSEPLAVKTLLLLALYVACVGGCALVGYLLGGWPFAVGLPIGFCVAGGTVAGAAGWWGLRDIK